MKFLSTSIPLIALMSLVPISLAPGAFDAHAQSASAHKQADENLEVSLKRGEVLQIIAPEGRADSAEARQTYYRAAYPIAEKLGYRRIGQLKVRQKVIGDYDPGGIIFFSWPNAQSVQALSDHPNWPTIKASRPDGWSELKIYTSVLEDDLKLSFDPAKHYTLVVAWGDDENPGDYERYLTGIESAVARSGGRFIYKMRNPSFEAHASPDKAPLQLTFVEWDSLDGFAKVQQSPEYLNHRQYFGSGLERFEFYWLNL